MPSLMVKGELDTYKVCLVGGLLDDCYVKVKSSFKVFGVHLFWATVYKKEYWRLTFSANRYRTKENLLYLFEPCVKEYENYIKSWDRGNG